LFFAIIEIYENLENQPAKMFPAIALVILTFVSVSSSTTVINGENGADNVYFLIMERQITRKIKIISFVY